MPLRRRSRPRPRSQYRLKRGPVVALLLVVGLVGLFLIARSSTRPQVQTLAPVTVPDAYEGTTYAVDGLVCLKATALGARVTGVSAVGDSTAGEESVAGRAGVDTRLVDRPAGAPPAVAYPVPPDAGTDLAGLQLARGQERCVRVLTTAGGQGERSAEELEVRFAYGPFGILRSTATVTPPVLLQVTGTGSDPRAADQR